MRRPLRSARSTAARLSANYNKNYIDMKKYVCDVCGYEYDPQAGDPDNGIAPGTPFEELPADWACPVCGVSKEEFSPAE